MRFLLFYGGNVICFDVMKLFMRWDKSNIVGYEVIWNKLLWLIIIWYVMLYYNMLFDVVVIVFNIIWLFVFWDVKIL